MAASRLAPSVTGPSEISCSSSGPLCAIRRTARRTQSASGLVPPASARHPAIPAIPPLIPATSLGLEPDDLRIHIVVLDQRAHQMAELIRPPESLRKYHWCSQPGKELLGVPAAAGDRLVDRGEDDPRADRGDP